MKKLLPIIASLLMMIAPSAVMAKVVPDATTPVAAHAEPTFVGSPSAGEEYINNLLAVNYNISNTDFTMGKFIIGTLTYFPGPAIEMSPYGDQKVVFQMKKTVNSAVGNFSCNRIAILKIEHSITPNIYTLLLADQCVSNDKLKYSLNILKFETRKKSSETE